MCECESVNNKPHADREVTIVKKPQYYNQRHRKIVQVRLHSPSSFRTPIDLVLVVVAVDNVWAQLAREGAHIHGQLLVDSIVGG